jgi:hypothetical protein
MSLHQVIPQDIYAKYLSETTESMGDFKKSLSSGEMELLTKLKNTGGSSEDKDQRELFAKAIIKERAVKIHGASGENFRGMGKAGVTSALGYNFYDLRAPVQLSYPVNVPFRNSLARIGRVNDGWGVAAHWKATRNPGIVYGGVQEGERNQISSPDENDYTATYKEIGVERGVTFTAQFAGEGFADNVADEHLRGLHTLWLQEESMMLLGNSGTASGNNGFLLGTPATPTVSNPTAGGSVGEPLTISVFVCAITALGNPSNAQYGYGVFPTVANGVTTTYARLNQDGTTTNVSCGVSKLSAVGTSGAATTSGNQTVTATTTSIKGAFGWAWYVNTTGTTAAGAYLYAITQSPSVTINTVVGTSTQVATAISTTIDYSANPYDFDGLLTYAASTAGAYWLDLLGASLTSGKDGTVNEIENVLLYLWTNFQAQVDTIWCGSTARICLDKAIRYAGTNNTGYQFVYTKDSQGNLMGGYLVQTYKSKWAMSQSGGQEIPIRTHPMLPPGAIYFDISQNPYPGSRAPFTRGMLVQREYYSIEWPLVTRQWTFGTYCHEVLAHNFPWITAVLAGVGTFVAD